VPRFRVISLFCCRLATWTSTPRFGSDLKGSDADELIISFSVGCWINSFTPNCQLFQAEAREFLSNVACAKGANPDAFPGECSTQHFTPATFMGVPSQTGRINRVVSSLGFPEWHLFTPQEGAGRLYQFGVSLVKASFNGTASNASHALKLPISCELVIKSCGWFPSVLFQITYHCMSVLFLLPDKLHTAYVAFLLNNIRYVAFIERGYLTSYSDCMSVSTKQYERFCRYYSSGFKMVPAYEIDPPRHLAGHRLSESITPQ
jgi:hypothetical protein